MKKLYKLWNCDAACPEGDPMPYREAARLASQRDCRTAHYTVVPAA